MENKLTFKNKHNEKLSCVLNENNSNSLAYIIPGEGENKNQTPYKKISRTLNSLKLNTLRCDLSSMGKSEGKPEDNNITKRVNDFLEIHNKIKNKYKKFYFVGFSFGALIGLIASTKIKFEKQFLLSTALFAENRKSSKKFLEAWKKLGVLPDLNSFKKGKTKPAKQKLNYKFVTELKKYKLKNITSKVKSQTLLICGEKEFLIKKQQTQIFKKLKVSKEQHIIKNTSHNLNNINYLKETIKWMKKK